ncbi:MAG: zinc-dependent metalloprotease [Bifidobacterium psychraerophilum]|uniref:zinc-dependent metalloprotease n=1 Tax=Bifidobacterium psychraerophilum TaxID=218140 RepID=UPI0039EBB676
MDDNAIHQWLIECFGPMQGEAAWQQFSQLPESMRDQIRAQGEQGLPKPAEVQSLIQAFTAGGLNTAGDVQRTVEEGPINIRLAKSIAAKRISEEGAQTSIDAQEGDSVRSTLSESSLWLDSVCDFNPAPGETRLLTRADWLEGTIDAWAQFAAPVASSMNEALASVFQERLGGSIDGEVSGMFAGPVPIPIPDNLKDPGTLMKLLGNTSFSMQLGQAAGNLSSEVLGSFDQGIALLKSPAGALMPQNIKEYAESLEIDASEVTAFVALHEQAHARLFASVPWLMPRFEALIGKYARGISIDLDAMEEQLRDATEMNPESIAGAVNLSNVGVNDTPEQRSALESLETLLALVDGWVDCVVWRAGMAHLPHIEQLREMTRRQRAAGGPAELTFESLLGLQLRPRRLREASEVWERITAAQGQDARDAMWSHPDMLPVLGGADDEDALIEAPSGASVGETADATHSGVDWDAELSKLLDDNASNQQHGADTDSNASEDKSSDADTDTKNDGNGDETTDPGDEKGSGTSQS